MPMEKVKSDFLTAIQEGQEVPFVRSLEKLYKKNIGGVIECIAELLQNNPQKRKVKKIAVFYPRLFDGGVERVISRQLHMLLELGYEVLLINENSEPKHEYSIPLDVKRALIPRKLSAGRLEKLQELFINNRIDTLIHHASSSQFQFFDTLLARMLGLNVIGCKHEVLEWKLLQGLSQKTLNFIKSEAMLPRIFTSLVVLNKMEEAYYRALGVKTLFIPNPLTWDQKIDVTPVEKRERKVIWIGRLDNSVKDYWSALEIMKLLVDMDSTISCVIVGPEGDRGAGEEINNFIKKNNLSHSVTWLGRRQDIDVLLGKSSVLLITSKVESFSMVLLEGMQRGLPTVLFNLENLELLQNNKSIIGVSNRDMISAAEAVKKILDDTQLQEVMSKEAVDFIADFYKQNDVKRLWSYLLKEELEDQKIELKQLERFVKYQQDLMQMSITSTAEGGRISNFLGKMKFKIRRALNIFSGK